MIIMIVGQDKRIDGRHIGRFIYIGAGKRFYRKRKRRSMPAENRIYQYRKIPAAKQVRGMAKPDYLRAVGMKGIQICSHRR
jgi:hypothetical protein